MHENPEDSTLKQEQPEDWDDDDVPKDAVDNFLAARQTHAQQQRTAAHNSSGLQRTTAADSPHGAPWPSQGPTVSWRIVPRKKFVFQKMLVFPHHKPWILPTMGQNTHGAPLIISPRPCCLELTKGEPTIFHQTPISSSRKPRN